MKKTKLNERFQELAGIKPLSEQGFDDRFKDAMGNAGFNDSEQDDIMSRDIESPFPNNDNDDYFSSRGTEKAKDLIGKLKHGPEHYRTMSDEELDQFSKEMIEHFLNNTAAQAAAKVFLARKGL
jgi:hypothetical protein|tara:strand:+ start:553 stop:924 length:372 start_codon:yes stop_codon:yes gene_type:complete